MSDTSPALIARLARLSPAQRSVLAARLGAMATAGNGLPGPESTRLVAYVVAREGHHPTADDLRRFLEARLPAHLVPARVVLLDRLPRTPNGKVDRLRLAATAPAEAAAAGHAIPETPAERALTEIWRDLLRVSAVGVHDNFFALGGDSFLNIRMLARARQAGLRLQARDVFQLPTIAELARVAEAASAEADGETPGTLDVPLTPIQRWFLDGDPPAPDHANLSVLLTAAGRLDRDRLRRAVKALLGHHEALRLRLRRDAVAWRQRVAAVDDGDDVCTSVDLPGPPTAPEEALARHAARAAGELRLTDGPLLRVVLFDAGPATPSRVLLIVHHLAADTVSLRILREDLETAYARLEAGVPVDLPRPRTSFAGWAARLANLARSGTLRAELPFWLDAGRGPTAVPVDDHGGRTRNTVGSARVVAVEFDRAETRRLVSDVPRAERVATDVLLATALVEVLARWSGQDALVLDLEAHGREAIHGDVDLSRTVGWFTALFPLRLERDLTAGPRGTLRRVAARLQAVPSGGIGHGVLGFLGPAADGGEMLRALPAPEVNFNYLGRLDPAAPAASLFREVRIPGGPDRWPGAPRSHLLEVVGAVQGGHLRVEWTYSEHVHRRETVEGLAREFAEIARALAR